MMSEKIQEKIWNIDLVVQDIQKFPQTYKTILKELSINGTCQTILRRKLNKLCKSGDVCKTNIPGTRFGKVVFYSLPKDYHILIESSRVGSKVYCFFKYKRIGKYYIEVEEVWRLADNEWEKEEPKKFFEGNVLKFL